MQCFPYIDLFVAENEFAYMPPQIVCKSVGNTEMSFARWNIASLISKAFKIVFCFGRQSDLALHSSYRALWCRLKWLNKLVLFPRVVPRTAKHSRQSTRFWSTSSFLLPKYFHTTDDAFLFATKSSISVFFFRSSLISPCTHRDCMPKTWSNKHVLCK